MDPHLCPSAQKEYSDLPMKNIEKHNSNVFLVNTGMNQKQEKDSHWTLQETQSSKVYLLNIPLRIPEKVLKTPKQVIEGV